MPRKPGPPKIALKKWDELKPMQQAFIQAYEDNGRVAIRAYKEAGYAWNPDWQRSNKDAAFKVRWNPHIDHNIKERLKKRHMSEDEALALHADQGRLDVGNYLSSAPHECPHCKEEIPELAGIYFDLDRAKEDGAGHLIKRIVNTKYGTNVEFYESDKARETIMKAHGTFVTKPEEQVGSLAALLASVGQTKLEQNGQPLLDE